jgi:hypothetical protein
VAHYGRLLQEQPSPTLVRSLKEQLSSLQSAPALRIELGQLLKNARELDRVLLESLLDSTNPSPLRLIAADVLLGEDQGKEPHPKALFALREIARLPNREMALTAADIVQRQVGVDMGLPLGQPLPPLHSRQAADVTRRLMQWAAQQDVLAARAQEEEAASAEEKHGSGLFGLGTSVN